LVLRLQRQENKILNKPSTIKGNQYLLRLRSAKRIVVLLLEDATALCRKYTDEMVISDDTLKRV
jgi:hypothetical protein